MTQKNETNDKVSILTEMNFRPSASRHSGRKVIPNSVLTVVKHKSSTRLTFSPEVIQKIGATENVQVALNPEGIAIGLGFTGDENYFPLKKFGKKFNIYSSQLVNEIIDDFSLDFSDVSSISFQRVRYLNNGSHKIAFFKIIQNKLKPSHDMTNLASNLASNIPTPNDNNKEGDFDTDPNLISLVSTYSDLNNEDELIGKYLDPRDVEDLTDVEFELNDADKLIDTDHDQDNDGDMINRVPKSSPFKHKRRRKVINE